MSSRPLITGTAIGKFYYRGCSIPQHAANLILGTSHGERFWALEPMNISVSRGEAVGVIGRNGSGKSTLLQILCRTVKPNSGYVDVNGRVAGLLELGAGFSPDFTGRENAVMNAAVHGLKEKEIQARLPAIADFAGIGDYFDRPVREYSSGMFARLAFAVATHVDADLLVVDEILAVGDAAFQRKCMARMRQFREAGGALLFVSHSSLAVLSVCERSIWLDHGAVRAEGPSEEVNEVYQLAMAGLGDAPITDRAAARAAARALPVPQSFRDPRWAGKSEITVSPFRPDAPWHGHGGARVIDAGYRTPDGRVIERLEGGEEVELWITCEASREVRRPIIGFMFRDAFGQNLFGDNSFLSTYSNPPAMAAGERFAARFRFQFPYLPAGDYYLAPSIIEGTQADHIHLHWMENAVHVRVARSPVGFGVVGVPMRSVGFA
ncbi:MAG: ABC transporter ATP-binding protein [Rhodobiaceae bacterium]|nr:ABC transporter ATP-binding protein [Rhodobiaceae bacterium]